MRTLVALIVAAAAVAGGVALWWPDGDLPGLTRDPAPVVGDLTFLDHASDDGPVTVDLVPPSGEVTVAYFGYLGCPDMCPLTMADLKIARDELGAALADRITVAFVTVDPVRDDGDRIRDYLRFFFDDASILALRARDDAALAEATQRFGVRYEVPADAAPDASYEVSHTAITYLIDDTGTVIRELPFGAPTEDYTTVLRAALTP